MVQTAPTAADPFATLDATAQAELVRSGQTSATELVEAAIARIEATNGALNAVTHKLYDQARRHAAGAPGAGPFAGVPFLIKDLLSMAGDPNTMGCRALASAVASESSPYAAALDAAGLVVVGRTNTPEFGLIDTTEPKLFGPTHNPWDLARSPAGSSGGAGAAVAAGMTPMAHASDGGGSIRLPACNNGVFGLKPSRGRNRSAGMPPPAFGLPAIGVDHALTRSVRDSALLLSLTEDPETPLGRLGLVRDPLARPLRIGLVRVGTGGQRAVAEVDDAALSTARLCESLGHHVEETVWPFSGPAVLDAFLDTCDVLLSPVLRHLPKPLGDHATDLPFETLFERVVDNVAYTPVFNVAGTPAMSVPLNWSAGGLPIGSQFAARVGGEATLLGLAYQLEAARPWAGRWAPHSYPAVAGRP